MPSGDAAAENQLLYRPRPSDPSDAGPGLPWDEQVPPPGRDATLLAVVPIPGTKTPRYLADNAGAADTELSAADLAELDALPAPQGARY